MNFFLYIKIYVPIITITITKNIFYYNILIPKTCKYN